MPCRSTRSQPVGFYQGPSFLAKPIVQRRSGEQPLSERYAEDPDHTGLAEPLPVAEHEPEWLIASYDEEIHLVDQKIGERLAWLESLGIADDSLIVITSDHGEEFLEHGLSSTGSSSTTRRWRFR